MQPWRFSIFLCALPTLLASLGLAGFFLTEYATWMLPVVRHALGWWSPQFDVLDVQVLSRGVDTVIEAALMTREHFVFYGHVIPSGGIITTSTLAGHMLVHVVLLTVFLAAWPARLRLEWVLRLAAAIPALFMLAWIDVPLIMTGSMHALILENVAPTSLSTARLVLAMEFLENGGRYVLILLTGCLVVFLCRKAVRQS